MKRTNLALVGCFALFSALLLAVPSAAQKDDKTWMKWSQKEADKMLTDSPWASTQIDTDNSEMFYSPTTDPRTAGRTANDAQRTVDGATNQSVNVKFHVRFFSARPIRSALARMMELQMKPDAAVAEKLHSFAELKATDSIILTLSFEATDQRYAGVVMQTMASAVTGTLKNETYLERDGKRLFLEEYIPPGRDGFGARFIFLRHVDGQPFINSSTGEVRFRTKYSNGLKVERVFNVSKMLYNGELEY